MNGDDVMRAEAYDWIFTFKDEFRRVIVLS